MVDARGKVVLEFENPTVNHMNSLASHRRIPTFQIVDLDGDRHDDVVYGDIVRPDGNRLDLYFQDEPGRFRHEEIPLEFTLTYGDTDYRDFTVCWVACADLTGDGQPEIITLLNHLCFYPALCVVHDREGRVLFELRHPGRMTSCLVSRDENDRPLLYLAGTNNFIEPGEKSAPILIRVQADWSTHSWMDFLGPDRTLEVACSEGTTVHYVNFRKDRVNPNISAWEAAYLSREGEDGQVLLLVGDQGLRHFVLDRNLRVRQAYALAYLLADQGLSEADYQAQHLLDPLYWTGTQWSEAPQAVQTRKRGAPTATIAQGSPGGAPETHP